MNKEQLIAGLVTNCKCKFSKEKLESWDVADLTTLAESFAANEEASASPVEVPAAPAAPAPAPAALPPELVAWMAGMESMVKGLTANSEREKAEVVAAIVANCRGAFSEADLMRYDLPKLNQVYSSYLPRDYSGNGGYVRANSAEEEAMPMPWPDAFKKLGV